MSCIIHETCDSGNIDVTVTVFRGCAGRNVFHGALHQRTVCSTQLVDSL